MPVNLGRLQRAGVTFFVKFELHRLHLLGSLSLPPILRVRDFLQTVKSTFLHIHPKPPAQKLIATLCDEARTLPTPEQRTSVGFCSEGAQVPVHPEESERLVHLQRKRGTQRLG